MWQGIMACMSPWQAHPNRMHVLRLLRCESRIMGRARCWAPSCLANGRLVNSNTVVKGYVEDTW